MLRLTFLSFVLGTGLLVAGPSPAAKQLAAKQPAAQQQTNEHEIATVTGLDGATYEAYQPAVVREVQEALKTKGLYQGEATGVLDNATMKAILKFQKQNKIEENGVPTPDTRRALLGHE